MHLGSHLKFEESVCYLGDIGLLLKAECDDVSYQGHPPVLEPISCNNSQLYKLWRNGNSESHTSTIYQQFVGGDPGTNAR